MVAVDLGVIFKFCQRKVGIGFVTEWALAESGYNSLRSIPHADDSAYSWMST